MENEEYREQVETEDVQEVDTQEIIDMYKDKIHYICKSRKDGSCISLAITSNPTILELKGLAGVNGIVETDYNVLLNPKKLRGFIEVSTPQKQDKVSEKFKEKIIRGVYTL